MNNHSNANLPVHQPATARELLAAMFAKIDFKVVYIVLAFTINAGMTLFIAYTTYQYWQYDPWAAIPAVGWTFASAFFTLLVAALPEDWHWYAMVCAFGNLGLIQLL